MKKEVLVVMMVMAYVFSFGQQASSLKYKNAKLPPEARAKDLLGRMSLEDKVAQLYAEWSGHPYAFDEAFFADTATARKILGKGLLSVQPQFVDIKTTVQSRNLIQKYLKEQTKWGIPAMFVDEGQHGLMKPEATSFPMAIGLACSWDTDLFENVYTAVAHEMRSRGGHHVLSPVIDVCRDPRWGRVEETYGEDPYLNGRYAVAAVKGLQGSATGIVAPGHVAATLKHFCGHGQPEGGINQAPGNFSERVLREFHFPPFKAAVEEANPVAIMPSYNEVDGKPSHNNDWLLKTIVRHDWGYKGMLVSDYGAIDELFEKHLVAKDLKDAACKAFNSGVEYEFPTPKGYLYLPALVKEGKVKQADIDTGVYKALRLKFQMGLFENPYTDVNDAIKVSKDEKARALALKAAQESIVLLKNKNNLLPLGKGKYKKIAVVGPCANNVFTGGYSGEPYQKITILEGIKSKLGKGTEVLFAQGCKIVDSVGTSQFNWQTNDVKFTSREENLKLIKQAVEVAKDAEVIVVAVGEAEQLCREAWTKEHVGDDMTLDLIGEQEELVEAMLATGKPVVVYLMNGRPLSINYIAKHVPAILEGWYMGQETGSAAADILFGDVNPSGKLTITIPKSAGQLPMYYNHKPSAQFANYVSQDVQPLYQFGYGLSYTNFAYSNMQLSADKMKADGSITVSIDVTNTGKLKGDEIAELYIHQKVASVTRPVMELKGFERFSLEAGQTKKISFVIDKSKLAFWDYNMKYTVEPGEFEIMVGKSSADYFKTVLTVE
ncbi:glycoside hydrolase family 3 N-terminal domain-containing protein [Parasediminibacterium sp. JCM 36343]|uniref:glycoside hydrolase family 3 N-terminal domain-containing protein n=1 Tax=Parasediminibacterium sp. JCM 36343 TaxID=3374279 RepID=UPI00397B5FFA